MGMRAKKLPVNTAKFPAGKLCYAIGDIHGRADLLVKMLDKIEADAAQSPSLMPIVVFLGDYVDRGLESKRVMDTLLSNRPAGFERHFLRGNHEQAMQQFLADPIESRGWLAYGGAETLISYGVRPVSVEGSDDALLKASEALGKALPDAHRQFLDLMSPSLIMGDYFFVHAGIDPNRSETEQLEHDLYWIRDRFLNDNRFWAKMVVHGHTPIKEAYRDHRRIGVDTGAYATGKLTAARLEGNAVAFITV